MYGKPRRKASIFVLCLTGLTLFMRFLPQSFTPPCICVSHCPRLSGSRVCVCVCVCVCVGVGVVGVWVWGGVCRCVGVCGGVCVCVWWFVCLVCVFGCVCLLVCECFTSGKVPTSRRRSAFSK